MMVSHVFLRLIIAKMPAHKNGAAAFSIKPVAFVLISEPGDVLCEHLGTAYDRWHRLDRR